MGLYRLLGKVTDINGKIKGYMIVDMTQIPHKSNLSVLYLSAADTKQMVLTHDCQNAMVDSSGKLVGTESDLKGLTEYEFITARLKNNKFHIIQSLWEGKELNGYTIITALGMVRNLKLSDALDRAKACGLANAKITRSPSGKHYISGIKQKIPKHQLGDPSDKAFLKLVGNTK